MFSKSATFRLTVFPVLIVLLLGVWLIIDHPRKTSSPTYFPSFACTFPKRYSVAVWNWEDVTTLDQEEQNKFLNNLKAHDITGLYLYTGHYIDLLSQPDSEDRQAKLAKYSRSLKSFLENAQAQHITVDALFGSSDWIVESKYPTLTQAIDFAASTGFHGVQFDIEPYAQSSFHSSPEAHLTNFFQTVDFLTSHLKSQPTNFPLGLTAPNWYGLRTLYPNTPALENGRYSVAEILFQKLSTTPNSYLALMDYRNFTSGPDGSIAHAKVILDQGQKTAPQVKVVIGQETGFVEPTKITFYGHTKNDLRCAISDMANSFREQQNLGGFAIHQLQNYLKLKDF